ncbi:MAG: hypothetical protein A370_00759 [Clostridium sp. Maddingley MBC34-26]|nr:MAG: hypothetical protein A370_00759 [Clostridium sp. Maddingley MBC34-26]
MNLIEQIEFCRLATICGLYSKKGLRPIPLFFILHYGTYSLEYTISSKYLISVSKLGTA